MAGKNQLDRSHYNAAERIAAGHLQSTIAGCLLGHVRQFVEIQIKAGHRTDHVRIVAAQDGVQRIRVLYMLLRKILLILRRFNIEPPIGYDPPFVERILVGMTQSDEFVVLLEIRELQRAGPADGFERCLQCPLQVLHHFAQLIFRGYLIEATYRGRDGVNLSPAEHLDNAVSDLLHPQRPLHYLPMIAGHGDHVLAP